MKVNANFQKMKPSYLFSEIAKRTAEFRAQEPDKDIIRLGIGDVTRPLCPAVVEAGKKAADEMGRVETFRGYAPDGGYPFIREAVSRYYARRGVEIAPDEIFVSDGAKCDCGNIQELFGADVKIAVGDPVYPVYVDTNVMAGRTGPNEGGRYANLVYLDCTAANGYVPSPADLSEPVDVVYLCYPNNPTGAVATLEQLQTWVDWARANKAIILFDAAYEAFIRTPGIPRSIYACKGARECAIEFRSYSKTAGFTGVRCGYSVVPKGLVGYTAAGEPVELRPLWTRRQTTKFNGASYISQRGAEAVYSPEGRAQTKATIDFYLENAKIVKDALVKLGYDVTGGVNSPYLWVNVKGDSWEFFDRLLKNANVVTTPGAGFGRAGQGYIRISAFNSRANVEEAVERLAKVLA